MTIEGFLTRELDIRFIDARAIVNEAKINLGIHGYPSKDQQRELRGEAVRLFHAKQDSTKLALKRLSANLEAVKHAGSSHSATSLASSTHSTAAGSMLLL